MAVFTMAAADRMRAESIVDGSPGQVGLSVIIARAVGIARAYMVRNGMRDGLADRAAFIGAVGRLKSIDAMTPVDAARVVLTDVAIQRAAKEHVIKTEGRSMLRCASMEAFLREHGERAFMFHPMDKLEDIKIVATGRFEEIRCLVLAARIAADLKCARERRDNAIDVRLHELNGSYARPPLAVHALEVVSAFLGWEVLPSERHMTSLEGRARRLTAGKNRASALHRLKAA